MGRLRRGIGPICAISLAGTYVPDGNSGRGIPELHPSNCREETETHEVPKTAGKGDDKLRLEVELWDEDALSADTLVGSGIVDRETLVDLLVKSVEEGKDDEDESSNGGEEDEEEGEDGDEEDEGKRKRKGKKKEGGKKKIVTVKMRDKKGKETGEITLGLRIIGPEEIKERKRRQEEEEARRKKEREEEEERDSECDDEGQERPGDR
jgi:hypothetical protein